MNWYLNRDGQPYGPYDPQTLQAMILEGRVRPEDPVWREGTNTWIPASQAGFTWPSQVPSPPTQVTPAQITPPQQPPKKKRGCLGCLGCLGTAALVPVALVAGLVLWLKLKDSPNMTLGARKEIASQQLGPGGGVISVGASTVQGMTVEVSDGSYETSTAFVVKETEIKGHRLGPLFQPATPLITIDNGHQFAKHPMVVKIPVAIAEDEFALGFYYDRKRGRLEGIPLVDENATSITLMTRHFSDLVISKAKKAEIAKGLPAESGFQPGVDDWQFVNNGSWLASGGHCAGQSISSMWYYLERKKGASERGLYGRYDNNDYGTGTIDFDFDDSWGYRFASVVQNELDWNNLMRWVMMKFKGFDTRFTWLAFAYAIQITGEPQYIGIRGTTTNDKGEVSDVGHAMVVYKVDEKGLYVADPNYPGNDQRKIPFGRNGLQPYESGLTKEEIAKGNSIRFPVLLYIGKSSMADWGKVGARYAQVLDGTIGNDAFPKWVVHYLVKVGRDDKWPDVPKVIETDEPTTALPSNGVYKGKLRFSFRFPYNQSSQGYQVALYRDTTCLATTGFDAHKMAYFDVPLTQGVNNLGFYYYQQTPSNGAEFIDFRRVKVIYGDDDLSGTWSGKMVARPTGTLRTFLEDGMVLVLRNIFPDKSEAELRSAAASSITEHVAELPFTLTLTRNPKDKTLYDFVMEHRGEDGKLWRSDGEATSKEGTLTFRAKAADGSVADYQGSLSGKGILKGTLDVDAWGMVAHAVTGEWQAQKQP